MENDDDKLLTTEQLASLRNVPPSRIEKERLKGEGPAFIKDGHLVRYRLGDYRSWIASKQRFTSTSEQAAA
ncbi:DNA-binding protein [Altererythrobacter aurantiacus]|uniref:DNA-binding protein n=1 Tax=Parapontixanthobacter aurantiacus TaxID=1463599 RepID=A0A844ZHM4_9SPHN|nr:DNA-binding protein [Parapontixanthobacter aurantiacus]MXO85229.1 DNA-binding protein [Parapontixanthobacter aurantiacus]